MGGEEVRSGCEESEGLDGADIAVLKVHEPARYVGAGDSGDDLLKVHGLSAEADVGEDAAGYRVSQTAVVADEASQVEVPGQ